MCHVKTLDKYLQVLPPEATDKDVFYFLSKLWFQTVSVGENQLNTMLKEMCAEAGILPTILIIALGLMVQQQCFRLMLLRN